MPRPNKQRQRALAELLHDAREDSGLSIRRLAELSGVDKALISRIEASVNKTAQLGTLNKLAVALDLEPDALYEAAGYFKGASLPSPAVYFRSKYGELPEQAAADLERYVTKLATKYGGHGPKRGEDEQAEPKRPATRSSRRKS